MNGLVELFNDPTIATIGIALAACTSCAIVGVYLVLRGMSLLGDAISHGVLPGLVVGFMVSGSRSLWPMLIGAVIAALLTAFLTELLRRRARIEANAGMGVVFTSLFAFGVILMHLEAERVDLDPGCVLYGQMGVVAIKTFPLGPLEVPFGLVSIGMVLLLDVVLIAAFWKELKITSFDPALATTLGISAGLVHYLLMTQVAVTTVACFESVGSILVIAMLIVPGATAHLLTDRLSHLVLIAVAVSWVSAISGCLLADRWNVSEAGMISVCSGACFGLAVFFAPRHGIVARWWRRMRLALRILREDLLADAYRRQERAGESPQLKESWQPAGGSGLLPAVTVTVLRWRGLLARDGDGFRLTRRGMAVAGKLVRSHRIWEAYLSEKLGIPLDHVHEPAHRMEHFVDEELAEAILERLDRPGRDPHGREIPSR